jgi:membrane-associated protein
MFSQLHDLFVSLFFELGPGARHVFTFVLAFGEGVPILGSFLPGGTIALLIGSLTEEAFIRPWVAVNLIAIGSLLGDLLGFFFGKKMLHWNWVRNFVNKEKHAKAWDLFDRHAAMVIIFSKSIPIIRSTPALFAGIRDMKTSRYILYALAGSYIWALSGIFGGKYLAQIFGDKAVVVIVGILVVSLVVGVGSSLIKKKESEKTKENIS